MINKTTLILFAFTFAIIQNSWAQEKLDNSKIIASHLNVSREMINLKPIESDSLLDRASSIILKNKNNLKDIDNYYLEDSVRNILYNSGIPHCQFEIKELSKKNIKSELASFVLNDSSRYIKIGYSAVGNDQLIIKIKKYLEYDHSESHYIAEIDEFTSTNTVPVKEVETKYYAKVLVPDTYNYYLSDKIPGKFDKTKQIYKVNSDDGKIIIDSFNTDKYIVVFNSKNEIIFTIK